MHLDKDKQAAASSAGYERMASDSTRWINKSTGSWIQEKGDSYIVKNGHHTPYGKNDQSLTNFKKRI